MFRKVSLALLAMAAFLVLNQATDVFAAGPVKFQALRSAPLYGPAHEVTLVNFSDSERVVKIYYVGASVVGNPEVRTVAPGGVYRNSVIPISEVRYGMVTWEGGPDDIGATWCAFRTLLDYPTPGTTMVCTEMK